jgi:hypothetical protein
LGLPLHAWLKIIDNTVLQSNFEIFKIITLKMKSFPFLRIKYLDKALILFKKKLNLRLVIEFVAIFFNLNTCFASLKINSTAYGEGKNK